MKNHFFKKLFLSGIISVILIFGLTLSINAYPISNILKSQCQENTLFDIAWTKSEYSDIYSNNISGLFLDKDGTIEYLYDNFDSYSENQFVLDHFENINSWTVNEKINQLRLADEYYGGHGSAFYVLRGEKELTLTKNFDRSQNIKQFNNLGYITMWIKIEDANSIDNVNILLEDKFGNLREYSSLVNVHTLLENTFGNDDSFSDLTYPVGDSKIEKWIDFILASGWNYLLWRTDEYTDSGNIDLSQLQKIHLIIKFNDNSINQKIIFDDLRIQPGLQKNNNPTNGAWFPPHGRPQYGVYDIDQNPSNQNDYELRLLNVRNSQYITNGDHARMISSAPVPENFSFRVKFTLNQLGLSDKDTRLSFPYANYLPAEWIQFSDSGQRDNSYFRVTYDFEPNWDPGHDWVGAYLSLQYDKFGLVSVWPVVRNLEQEQEPKQGDPIATNTFVPIEDVMYQMDILVLGQKTIATIYEVQDDCLISKSSVGYVFKHPRHGSDERYPIAIESTGNMRTIIHEVELITLEKLNDKEGI